MAGLSNPASMECRGSAVFRQARWREVLAEPSNSGAREGARSHGRSPSGVGSRRVIGGQPAYSLGPRFAGSPAEAGGGRAPSTPPQELPRRRAELACDLATPTAALFPTEFPRISASPPEDASLPHRARPGHRSPRRRRGRSGRRPKASRWSRAGRCPGSVRPTK